MPLHRDHNAPSAPEPPDPSDEHHENYQLRIKLADTLRQLHGTERRLDEALAELDHLQRRSGWWRL